MNQIKLGSQVRCLVSGVEGIAVSKTETFNGNTRYAVQPRGEDAKSHPDAWEIDQQFIEQIGEGLSARTIEAPPVEIAVGDKVRDRASGLEGIAVSKGTHMNGCVHFNVVPKKEKLTDDIAGAYFSVERLELVKKQAIETPKPKSLATGGPSARAPRMF